jgi:hypothetical protein
LASEYIEVVLAASIKGLTASKAAALAEILISAHKALC